MGREGGGMRIGLYSPFFGTAVGGGEKYFGVTAEALRDALPGHQMEIISAVPVDVQRYERMLDLDLSGIGLRSMAVTGAGWGRHVRRLPGIRRYADLYLASRSVAWTRDYDVFLSMVYVMPAFSQARRGIILCQFPYQLHGGPPRDLRGLLYRLCTIPYDILKRRLLGSEVDSFQLVIAQSEYTRGWIDRYWDRDSVVVNPPIDVPPEEPDLDAKRPVILSVGRFFASGHCKRHDVMVEAFRRMVDDGLAGWELHLAGSLHRSNAADVRYFERVRELAQGYPVHIHADVPLPRLIDLYRQASIYWHAAGFGVDEQARPIDLEHFGMTTAEAMGYAAVPVAIARGGQVEVVEDGATGYLWSDVAELRDKTRVLIDDPAGRRRMAVAARRSSFRFSRDEFKRRMTAAVLPLVQELEAPAAGLSPGSPGARLG
jgi:glycosyltransferase involved in cell wall biosynthesis